MGMKDYATFEVNSQDGRNAKMHYHKEHGFWLGCVSGMQKRSLQAKHQKKRKIFKNVTFLKYTRHQNVKNFVFKKRYFKILLWMEATVTAPTIVVMTSSGRTIQLNSKTNRRWNIKKL